MTLLPLVEIAIGGALLFAGRRLYWLLAAALGFVAGLTLADLLLPGEPQTADLIIALALAGGGALLFVVFQKLLIGLIGFIAGGVALLLVAQALAPNLLGESWMAAAGFVLGGTLGAFLFLRLFSLGLIILSAIIGAYLLLAGLMGLFDLPDSFFSLALLLLIGVGIVIQLGALRRR